MVDELTGRGVPAAEVWLIRGEETLALTYTTSGGTYCFRGLPAGRYRVRVRSTRCGERARDVLLTGGLANLDFALPCSTHFAHLPLAIVGIGSR